MNEQKPFLQLDLNRVRENAVRFVGAVQETFTGKTCKTFFAVKSHPEEKILQVLAQEGVGFEVMTVSQAHMMKSLSTPWIISGFHKPGELLDLSAEAEYLVVENPFEIEQLIARGQPQRLLLRVKLNQVRKIGCSLTEIHDIATKLKNHPQLEIIGLHFHLGWNVKDEAPLREALSLMQEAHGLLSALDIKPRVINLGGSFCEDSADPAQLPTRLKIYHEYLGHMQVEFHFEPGRYMVGDAGTVFTQIVNVDRRAKVIYVNTCAYGYKLNAATPHGRLLDSVGAESTIWTIFGFWPAEGDVCTLELAGEPAAGGLLALENMGAYIWDLAFQFEPSEGIKVRFLGANQ